MKKGHEQLGIARLLPPPPLRLKNSEPINTSPIHTSRPEEFCQNTDGIASCSRRCAGEDHSAEGTARAGLCFERGWWVGLVRIRI